MGYASIGPFGADAYPSLHHDRLAREGRAKTNSPTANASLSESLAALLTGCHPINVRVSGALFQGMNNRLHPDGSAIGNNV